jgi:hypothetical protein
MSKRMVPYVVRPGDYLLKLAHRHGFDVDTVWNDPGNDDLRQRPGSARRWGAATRSRGR